MELAFRWIRYRKCYDAIYNTGSEWLCWEGAYNNFYANGALSTSLAAICFDTVAPTSQPTIVPTPEPTQFPSLSCDGEEYTDALGDAFLECGNHSIPQLVLETCDVEFQEDLYFGVANELFSNCSMPECVYMGLEYAFRWSDNDTCYKANLNDGNQRECWEENNENFWKTGDLAATLELICTNTPTHIPTEDPTLNPTETPTARPTLIPVISPTNYPTLNPTFTPTTTPTMAPTSTPTLTPTLNPSQNPTNATNFTQITTPSSLPTSSPLHSVSMSARISGIREAQISDTIAPLARATNVSDEMISVESYINVTWNVARRRLQISGFSIDYLIQVLQEDDATELIEVVMADNFSSLFIWELALELNISAANITIEGITATSSISSNQKQKSNKWIDIGKVFAVFFALLLVMGIAGLLMRCRAQREQARLLQTYSYEKRTPRAGKGTRRTRKRRSLDSVCCCTCTWLSKKVPKRRRRRSGSKVKMSKAEPEEIKNTDVLMHPKASTQQIEENTSKETIPIEMVPLPEKRKEAAPTFDSLKSFSIDINVVEAPSTSLHELSKGKTVDLTDLEQRPETIIELTEPADDSPNKKKDTSVRSTSVRSTSVRSTSVRRGRKVSFCENDLKEINLVSPPTEKPNNQLHAPTKLPSTGETPSPPATPSACTAENQNPTELQKNEDKRSSINDILENTGKSIGPSAGKSIEPSAGKSTGLPDSKLIRRKTFEF